MNFSRDSRCLHFASYAFDVSVYEIFNTLIFGGCVCVSSEYDRFNNMPGFFKDARVSCAILTPSTVNMYQPQDLPSLTTLVTAGEVVSRHTVDRWADKLTLINAYGPAEGTFCTVGAIHPRSWRRGTIGPMTGSVGWVVNPQDHEKLVPIAQIGELVIEGPIVTRGYFEDPEKTAAVYIDPPAWLKAFRPNKSHGRLYKTGDLVRYNGDGAICFVGRKDTQVKLRGQRIELEEVEFHVKNSFTGAAHVIADVIVPKGQGRTSFLVAFIWLGSQEQTGSDDKSLFLEPTKHFREMVQTVEAELSTTVPSFMVPHLFLPLKRLPLSPSQKVNRKELREACIEISVDQMQAYSSKNKTFRRAPSTDVEQTIHDIWACVLGIDRETFGVDDNFFRLGGDSIGAMRVVAQCATAGLRSSVVALFKAKTVAQMSLTIKQMHSTIAPPTERLGERFDLSPIQQLYFDTVETDLNHFNQSLSFHVPGSVSSRALKEAIEWIVTHHSMLRARFTRGPDGQWQQYISRDVANSFAFKEDRAMTRQEAASLIESDQRKLDIQNGPLLVSHVLFVDDGDELYLSLTVHHLVIDIVSWQVLLADLEQLLAGQGSPAVPLLSFQTWCQLQAAYAEQNVDTTEVLLQDALSFDIQKYWGIDAQDNCWGNTLEQGFVLTEKETQILTGTANKAFGTQPVEILHAALIQAFSETFKDRPCPNIFSEGHGREPWDPSIDPTRTIGWFTTMWPAHVTVQPADTLLETLCKTKDARRQVKNNGWAYFLSRHRHRLEAESPIEILFNYHPGFTENPKQLLQPASLVKGELFQMSPVMSRFALIDVLAEVADSRLSFNFIFNKRMQSSISQWIANAQSCLEAAASDLVDRAAALTLSDFPLLSYSYPELDAFSTGVLAALGASAEDVEDAYPCSPIQEGMLLSQAKFASHYLNRAFWLVRSRRDTPVREEQLRIAWLRVVEKHPLLRTVIFQSPRGDGRHDQVVLKKPLGELCAILPTCENPLQRLKDHHFDTSNLITP
ncbi:hypothetical protein CDD83_6742 [Cordyceps sp. RAO-2017]|nr:hypothetical protein CDD83_6742 [Cordyceps sp. RAO-2017]